MRDELDAEREAHEEALADQDHLRFQLQEATDRLEEAQEDIERLRDGKGSPDAGDSSAFGDQSRSRQLGEGKSRRQLEIVRGTRIRSFIRFALIPFRFCPFTGER